MGQLKSDGRASIGGFTAPSDEIINFGDLYRLNGWNHIAMSTIGADDTVRGYGAEYAPDRIWYVLLPDGLDPDVGDYLCWDDSVDGFARGDTDLVAADDGSAGEIACKVDEAVNDAGYAAVRVLNVGVNAGDIEGGGDSDVTPQAAPDDLTNATGATAGTGLIVIREDTPAHTAEDAETNDATLAAAINDLYALLAAAGVTT